MFESVGRGWKVTKVSFSILMEDRKLLLFPLLSAVFAILLLIGFIAPFFVLGIAEIFDEGWKFFALLFVYYAVTSFFAILFNVAMIHSLKAFLEGKNESIGASIAFALSRFFVILQWALISATVGVVLNALEGRKAGWIGWIVRAIIGVAWAVITFFVIPTLVYENLGVVETLKKSASTFKKTWGESITAQVSTGLIFVGIFFLWFLAFIALAIAGVLVNPLLIVPVLLVFFIGLILIALFSSAISNVFRLLLYLYAEKGVISPSFSEDELKQVFKAKQ